MEIDLKQNREAVSYTHLDVYKRQVLSIRNANIVFDGTAEELEIRNFEF